MSLFLLGFLPKGSQKLDCQLLICLFAADNKGINYFYIENGLLLFLIVLGLRLPRFIGAQYGTQPEKLRAKIEHWRGVGRHFYRIRYKTEDLSI